MKKYPLAITVAIFMIFIGQLSCAPPHENINESLEDPEVLHSYFLIELPRISNGLQYLAVENYEDAQELIDILYNDLRTPKKIVQELSTKELGEQLLPRYYLPFQNVYDQLDAIQRVQPNISSLLDELIELEEKGNIGGQLIIAKNLVGELESRAGLLEDNIIEVESLGYDANEIRISLSMMRSTISRYKETIEELEQYVENVDDVLYISAYETSSDENYQVRIDGFFYYNYSPVEENGVVLYVNDLSVPLMTDHEGAFSYLFGLPVNVNYKVLTIHAESTYNGFSFSSNVIKIGFEIPTTITISKEFSTSENSANIVVSGVLRDAYGNGLAGRNVELSINGESIQITTLEGGIFHHYFQRDIAESESFTIYSVYNQEEGSPYLYSKSQVLDFSIHITNTVESTNLEIVISCIIALLAIVWYIYKRGSAASSQTIDINAGEDPMMASNHRKILMKELGILEKIGNVKESIILGYSRTIEYLDSRSVIELGTSTTHLDIDKGIRRIADSDHEAKTITSTFEIARYSKRDIGRPRKQSFFQSIRSIVGKIGGSA